MRILTIGAAIALTLAACGTDDKACDPATDPTCVATGAATGTGTGGSTGETGTAPACLDLTTTAIFTDVQFTWSSAAGTTTSTVVNGNTIPSLVTMTLGDANFQGDTSLPGPPDNWCFIEYNIDGATNVNTDPGWWFALGDVNPANAVSNCGQESSVGAGDMVTLCDPASMNNDPAGYWAINWGFSFGGTPSADYDADIATLAGYGYAADEFMMSEWSFDLDGRNMGNDPEAWEAIAWAWETDPATGEVVLDGNGDPTRLTRYEMQGPGGLTDAFYLTYSHTFWQFSAAR